MNINIIIERVVNSFTTFIYRMKESIFVTKNQYRLRYLDSYQASNKKIIAIMQVAVKRVKIKFSIRYIASNKSILQEIHPVSVCKLSFIANTEDEVSYNSIPAYIKDSKVSTSIIKEPPTLQIISRSICPETENIIFTLSPICNPNNIQKTLTAAELSMQQDLLYGLGSTAAASVGIAASESFLRELNQNKTDIIETEKPPVKYLYYHILCVAYVGLLLSGISIVRRIFPFHVPFTNLTVPFGAGILFFPLTFCIQDVTTEVYGFRYARHMVWLAIIMVVFYIGYTQIAANLLPTGSEAIYRNNASFSVVYNTIPRQFFALIISLLTGMLLNDFFISKSKIIFGGQYLWQRIIGSTMVGEAVLQVVGGVIGFSDTMDFYTQLLPNMVLAYGYKMLWNAASVPLIYFISTYLKRLEGLDTFDYNVDYNPFKLSITR